jgi:hypothetical protein
LTDRQTSAIIIGVAVVWFLLWYRKRSEGERANLFGMGEPGTTPTQGEKAASGGVQRQAGSTGKILDDLLAFAHAHNLNVTSTTGGRHVAGSLHFQGRAIDVGGRSLTDKMVDDIKTFAAAVGIHVLDERKKMPWKEWSGPHLHLSVPIGGKY